MHVPGYTARSQPNYDKFPQRRCVWQEKSSEKKLSGRTSLHYDEANDLTFCHIYMVAYKDGKLNSNNLDFRTRRMLVLPSRITISQSAIGIDNNEQSDYLTCIQRKNGRSRLEGSK